MTSEELKEEMYQEAKQDAYYEKLMYRDVDYAITQYEDRILEAETILQEVSSNLDKYGHQISAKELLDYV